MVGKSPFQASGPGETMAKFVTLSASGARRLAISATCRLANRRLVFAFVTAAVLAAKFVHIHSHKEAFQATDMVQWGYTFFAHDILLLFAIRVLLDPWLFNSSKRSYIRLVAWLIRATLIVYVAGICVLSVTFYAVAGSEIRWRNVAVAGDASSRAMLLTGLFSLFVALCCFLFVAWLTQNLVFVLSGLAVDLFEWPLLSLSRRMGWTFMLPEDQQYSKYSEVLQDDDSDDFSDDDNEKLTEGRKKEFFDYFVLEGRPQGQLVWHIGHAMVIMATLLHFVLLMFRPRESSMVFLSWTTPLVPFFDFKNLAPCLANLRPVYETATIRQWDSKTALSEPLELPWLPKGNDSIPAGFEDWYGEKKKHYNASADPLSLSNLDEDLLPELKGKLGDVPIRHVMLIVLESTRKDIFPIKKDGLIWNRFADTFDNKQLPDDAIERIRTLTPTAKYLTGDYDDGFGSSNDTNKRRGGINFNDAYTSSTLTLKSIMASVCGLMPLVADFNVEHEHHFYQPCLPQILDVLGGLESNNTDHFGSYKWSSSYMQSATLSYDKTESLLNAMGFPSDHIISKDYLKKQSAKFGYVADPDVNYFGMAEDCLEDYIRDAFVTAKQKDERVFLTHMTSTSHHPYGMPKHVPYVPLANGLRHMSRWVNAIGYDDRWLAKILKVLDQEGVADETLVVLVGDHGISLPENNVPASYYNPNAGCNRVPLVFSHPKLPAFDVNNSVTSKQILPTILDLLLETGSLSNETGRAARDLLANFEGQSMIRNLRTSGVVPYKKKGKGKSQPRKHAEWQFTIINPGRAMVGVRDAEHKSWRLVVPTIDNIEWKFNDLERDPTDMDPVQSFGYPSFLKRIESKHGLEAAKWAEEAAFATRWWVEENSKLWQYGLHNVADMLP